MGKLMLLADLLDNGRSHLRGVEVAGVSARLHSRHFVEFVQYSLSLDAGQVLFIAPTRHNPVGSTREG